MLYSLWTGSRARPQDEVKLVVRRASLEDRDALARFYRLAYPLHVAWRFPERWQWEFVDDPFRPSADLPLWVVDRGGEIVGQSGAMCVRCRVGRQTVQAAWGVDFFVLTP